METKKWLNIIVDGNSALGPYWPKIVSDYLEKIVRSFFGNSREEGVSCEVGLVMYNANSNFGLNVQYINWTTDVDNFLRMLSYFAFNGDSLNQHTIVEGLAKALVMFPRPSNRMTMEDYFEGERHSILVATGDPVAKRMLVSLPMIKEGNFVDGEFTPLNANFMEVAKMFGPLGVTLSVITPMQNPVFASIFNLGNSLLVNTPITDYGFGECTVLLSRYFKEALNVLSCIKGTVESRNTAIDAILPAIFNDDRQEDLFSTSHMTTGQQSMEGVQNVRLESAVVPLSTDEIRLHSPSCSLPIEAVDDFMADIVNANDDILLPMLEGKTLNDLLDDTFGQDETQVLNMGAGEGSSRGLAEELGGNMGAVNPILSSENCSNSSLSLPQNIPNLGPVGPNEWYHKRGMNSTTVGLGTMDPHDPPQFGASFGHYTFPNTTTNSLTYGGSSNNSNHQQFPRNHHYQMGANSWASVPMMPQYNQSRVWPRPPSLTDIQHFVFAWQGYVVGQIHSNLSSLDLATALRRPTTPETITEQWPRRLEVTLFLPRKAVNYTLGICGGPIDYVFVEIRQLNDPDLYDHMMSKHLCAKIELPSQTLILSTTASKYHYLGTVFPGDTVFVEPMHGPLGSQSSPMS